jgi:hypothetical protein
VAANRVADLAFEVRRGKGLELRVAGDVVQAAVAVALDQGEQHEVSYAL